MVLVAYSVTSSNYPKCSKNKQEMVLPTTHSTNKCPLQAAASALSLSVRHSLTHQGDCVITNFSIFSILFEKVNQNIFHKNGLYDSRYSRYRLLRGTFFIIIIATLVFNIGLSVARNVRDLNLPINVSHTLFI
jgi:hypothetical protein